MRNIKYMQNIKSFKNGEIVITTIASLIARFMGPTWGTSGADTTQVGPMLAPWTLLSGMVNSLSLIGRLGCDFNDVILNLILLIGIFRSSLIQYKNDVLSV